MPNQIKKGIIAAVTAALMFTAVSAAAADKPVSANLHDAEAEALLKKMSDYMSGLKSLSADFYVFDEQRNLVYTGRAVDSPRDALKVTINDLENALDELISGIEVQKKVTNPIGCNVKWDGKEAHWMPPDACDLVI